MPRTLLLLLLGLSCKAEDPGPRVEPGLARGDCNPVDDSHCMLPFPSSFFLDGGVGGFTGYRMALGDGTLPRNVDGRQPSPAAWNLKDGFSTLGTLYAHLPEASLNGTVSHTDIDAYTAADARTLLINQSTGERVPHFVEREAAAAGTGRALLMLRPVAPLEHGTRYVVGIRGLETETGEAVPPPTGFRLLRDGLGTEGMDDQSAADLDRQREHYEAIVFPTLADAGVDKSGLQLAWSFVTGSAERSLGPARYMRDDALERIADGGPAYTLDDIEEFDCDAEDAPNIGRKIKGDVQVPSYLSTHQASLDSHLVLDARGLPEFQETVDVGFTVLVPCSVLQDGGPAPVLQYGHGLLGARSEVEDGYLTGLAQDNGWLLLATDWTGMSLVDAAPIALMMVDDPGAFHMVPDRVQQAYVEAAVALRLVTGPLSTDPALTLDDRSLVDGDRRWFYGNSQGGVLGGGYAALSTDIQRVVLGVPGTPFTLLLTRAVGFGPFFDILQTMYTDWADISLLIGAFQHIWDPGESAGFARFMNGEALDEHTPAKPVLIQAAIGDASVPTLGAHVMARAYGAALIEAPVRPVWGLDTQSSGWTGSALVEVDYGIEEPVESVPATDDASNPHNEPRKDARLQQQIATFLEEGTVVHVCDGPCTGQ